MKKFDNIPLSLYIHTPWCVRKCPYCDFNSHTAKTAIPELAYITALVNDLQSKRDFVQDRRIQSIFIGGGTPSLLSAKAYQELFSELKKIVTFSDDIEITLEANPGTVEQKRFKQYHDIGINRLSIGVQSLQNDKLHALGRIHNADEAFRAVEVAKLAGFKNINIDIMYGLPNQTIDDALYDLQQAIHLKTTHLSWYQLTLEPNTLFHHNPPKLPNDDVIWEMQTLGQALLKQSGFHQYEVSAYSKAHFNCRHNVNYWQFGDYIGIGAGAHGKVTLLDKNTVLRHWNHKHPDDFLNNKKPFIANEYKIDEQNLLFEFMLNALRLKQAISFELIASRTGLSRDIMQKPLETAVDQRFVILKNKNILVTSHGERYLNNLMELFLPS